tara:strand:+ start:317 stop:598 length:282 start_codon:yes stop_codon:yes gene_type:complete
MTDDKINENILNETMVHLKEQYEKFEKENSIILSEYRELQKSYCSVYGVIRVLDLMLGFIDDDIPLELINQIQLLRAFSSDIFEKQILKIDEE